MVINRACSLNFEAIRYGNYQEFILADWFLIPVLGNPFELRQLKSPQNKMQSQNERKDLGITMNLPPRWITPSLIRQS